MKNEQRLPHNKRKLCKNFILFYKFYIFEINITNIIMKKSKTSNLIFLLCFLAALLNSATSQKYATISSRTSSFMESCAGLQRSQMTVAESQKTKQIETFLRNYFNIDGAKVMKHYIAGQPDMAKQQIDAHFGPIFMLIFPFAIGALIAIILGPCLACCCCSRPWCCRSIKFWQRDDEPWGKHQLGCPPLLGLIFLLGIVATSGVGIAKLTQLQVAYDNTVCARAIVMDDLINGNATDTQYFVGLQSFQNALNLFLENFDRINSSFTNVTSTSPAMKNVLQDLGQTAGQLTNIPSGTGKELNLAYGSPLNAKKPTRTIRSTFTNQLGTITSQSSLIGVAYKEVVDTKDKLDTVASISDYYMQTSGPSTNQVGNIQNDVQNIIRNLYDIDQLMQSGVKQFQTNPYWLTIGSIIGFTFVIVFGLAGIVGLCCILSFNNIKFRFVLYAANSFLYLLTLLFFALTITTAILVPFSFFACDFASSSAANGQNFKQNFKTIITDQKTRVSVSTCVPSQLGTMLNSIAGDNMIKSMQALPKAMTAMSTLKPQQRTAMILEKINAVKPAIQQVMYARKIDINDDAGLKLLNKLSLSYQYTCTGNGFHQDSWIPSINQQQIPCKFGIGAVADHTTCAMGDDFEGRVPGCVGCIDTSAIFRYTDTYDAVNNALTKRYPPSTCGVFISDLSYVWNNYYKIKQSVLGPVLQRYDLAKSSIQILTESLKNDIDPLFNNTMDALNTSAPGFIHPKYGLGSGLNCGLIGEDLKMLSDNSCNRLLPRLYIMLIIYGVLSFSLLIATCFGTCTVSRHLDRYLKNKKQQQDQERRRDRQVKNNKGNQQSQGTSSQSADSEARINIDQKI